MVEFNSNITPEMCSSGWMMLLLRIMADMLCFEACVDNGGSDYSVEWKTTGGVCWAECSCDFDCGPGPGGGRLPRPAPGDFVPWSGGHPFACTDANGDGWDDLTGDACD